MVNKYLNVLKLIKKPSKKELWEYTKLVFLGLGILGIAGFIIWYVFGLFIVR